MMIPMEGLVEQTAIPPEGAPNMYETDLTAESPLEEIAQDLAIESQERGEGLLARLSIENIKTDIEVSERFGSGVWERLKEMGTNSLQKLEVSGEKALGWIEERGIPLPQSKIGNAIAAGTLGIAGLAPGAGLLWGIAYTFAKRARAAGAPEMDLGTLLEVQEEPTYASA